MLEWLRLKFKKASTLSRIVEAATTNMNRSAHDFLAQADIRERMEKARYTYVGNPGAADAALPKSYKP